MRNYPIVKAERYRVADPLVPPEDVPKLGRCGAFFIPYGQGVQLAVVVGDGGGWDHVSVHARQNGGHRTPSWEEMSFIKNLFFKDEEAAVQYHPAKADYVNEHPSVLHLWRPQTVEERWEIRQRWGTDAVVDHWPQPDPLPFPPKEMV